MWMKLKLYWMKDHSCHQSAPSYVLIAKKVIRSEQAMSSALFMYILETRSNETVKRYLWYVSYSYNKLKSHVKDRCLERCREAANACHVETLAAITIQRCWKGYITRQYCKVVRCCINYNVFSINSSNFLFLVFTWSSDKNTTHLSWT